MFLGRTGVGKTEMAIAAAKVQYGDQWANHYRRIDCTSLREHYDMTKIGGASPGYVGYGDPPLITADFLKQEGGVVVLFDEFEKAHRDVQKMLLPVLQEGELVIFAPTEKNSSAGSKGKEVAPTVLDFRNAFIIFTSNTGTEALSKAQGKQLGFQTAVSVKPNNRAIVLQELRREFSHAPEFLGRLGETNVVVFNDLGHREYQLIFDKTIERINKDLKGIKTPIVITSDLKEWLIKKAVGDGRYGARDIEHIIEDFVLTKAAEIRSSGSVKDGSILGLGLDSDGSIELLAKDVEVIPLQPAVGIPDNSRALSAPASPDVQQVSSAPAATNEKQESVLVKERGIPFKITPSFKMAQDIHTGRNMEEIKIKVNTVGDGVIQIAEFTPKGQDDSGIVFASDDSRLYELTIKMLSTSPNKIPSFKIIIPAGEFEGLGKAQLVGGMCERYVSKWKGKNGKISPLVLSRVDFESLDIIITRKKAHIH